MYKFVMAIFLVLFCNFAVAASVTDINIADVPVAGQSPAELNQALPSALAQVLIKISGHSEIAEKPAIKAGLSRANQWLQSYSYHSQQDAKGNLRYFVRVVFDQKGIVDWLQSEKQPVWSNNRPQTLICIHVTGDQPGGYILSNNDNNNLIAVDLKNNAFTRGISYLLPMMDLQDQASLNLQGAQSFNTNQLQEISKRYGVDTTLAGNLTLGAGNIWQGEWLLLFNGEPYQWNSTDMDLNSMIAQTINKTADLMANQFAVVGGQETQDSVKLAVLGVNDLDEYIKVMKYLRSLEPVSRVEVSNMDNSTLLLDVSTVGGKQTLINALHDSYLLSAMTTPSNSSDSSNNKADLYYRCAGSKTAAATTTTTVATTPQNTVNQAQK